MIKKTVRFFSFLLLFVLTFLCCSKIMTVPGDDYRSYQWVRGFYDEPKDSLDMVFIGASNTYAFLEPPLIFLKYGLTSWSFTAPTLPSEIAEYLLKETRKRQPDALYIINVSNILENFPEPQIHHIIDYFPLSYNRLALTHFMLDYSNYGAGKRAEFYVPIVRYHSRWKSLRKADFAYRLDGFKGGSTYSVFLNGAEDVSETFINDATTLPIPQKVEECFLSLLGYCDENQVRVLFMISPQPLKQNRSRQMAKSLKQIITERGYAVMDFDFDDIGLDPKSDFYNESHTNIHGAIKVEDAVIRYVKERYDFEDKRNNADFSNWDKAAEDYLAFVDKYLTGDEKDFIIPPQSYIRITCKESICGGVA